MTRPQSSIRQMALGHSVSEWRSVFDTSWSALSLSRPHAALELLAYAIENADEERADAWYLRETAHGIALMAGRMLACKVTRSKAQISVIGPVADEIRAVIGAEPEDDEEFKKIPGGILLTFPLENADKGLVFFKDGLKSFVDI